MENKPNFTRIEDAFLKESPTIKKILKKYNITSPDHISGVIDIQSKIDSILIKNPELQSVVDKYEQQFGTIILPSDTLSEIESQQEIIHLLKEHPELQKSIKENFTASSLLCDIKRQQEVNSLLEKYPNELIHVRCNYSSPQDTLEIISIVLKREGIEYKERDFNDKKRPNTVEELFESPYLDISSSLKEDFLNFYKNTDLEQLAWHYSPSIKRFNPSDTSIDYLLSSIMDFMRLKYPGNDFVNEKEKALLSTHDLAERIRIVKELDQYNLKHRNEAENEE